MGKRKHYEEEERLARKIRKLEKKMSRVRRKQREKSHRSSSSDQYSLCSLQEFPQDEGPPHEDNISSDSIIQQSNEIMVAPTPAPTATMDSAAECASTEITTADVPPVANTSIESSENIEDLEPDILQLLGEEPVREERFGQNIHKDISNRWSDILVNGLKDETKSEISQTYSVPENLKLALAPILNPEIRAAINESAIRRDKILAEKQNILTTVITCIANTITIVLKTSPLNEEIRNQAIKPLSDAGRLLCLSHYNETQTRKNFLLSSLNKEIKDNVKDLKRDHLLFGSDLQENLKSMKAIIRTGSELKPAATTKPRLPQKNTQPKEQSNRALNWRGPLPPQSHPRRMAPRHSATVGGRKQQPAHRAADRRAPRQYNRVPRR